MDLCYKVICENTNSRSIEFWNVFEHGKFKEAAKAYLAGELTETDLQREACYYFWGKCEYEVVVRGWPNQKTEKKLDIYDQLTANWSVFMNYLDSKATCSWEDEVDVRPDRIRKRLGRTNLRICFDITEDI